MYARCNSVGPTNTMTNLLPIQSTRDIPEHYRHTPIADLLEYHNLNRTFDIYAQAQLLIGMCMDNRKSLRIPDNFAFILRAGGANLRYSGFKVSYAIAVGGVRHLVLLGHTQCAMVNLLARKEQFIQGLIDNAGWNRDAAEKHFTEFSAQFEIGDEVSFLQSEAKRLRATYPKVMVCPMMYRVEDNRLYLVTE